MMRNFILAGLILFSFCMAPAMAEAPPVIQESTREADKAAVQEAASEADQWKPAAAKEEPASAKDEPAPAKDEPAAAGTGATPTPDQAEAPMTGTAASKSEPAEPAKAVKPAAPAAAPRRSNLNEMTGKVYSVGTDPRILRITVNGYNVGFTYDSQTVILNGGNPIPVRDLSYNDTVIVRYAGKELLAVEIERIKKVTQPE